MEASKPQDYDFTLHNYPNPFNPITTILYSVETQNNMSQQVDLSIYNVLGQKICTLVSEKQKAGRYQVEWNASGLNSGVFIVQLISGLKSKSKKILLVK